MSSKFILDAPKMAFDYEDTIVIIEKLVQGILDDCHIISPPVDPYKIAKKLRMPCTESGIEGRRGQNFLMNGNRIIEINKNDRFERKCFTLAHELIEVLLPARFKDINERHDIAMIGAPYVLMPTEWFGDECINKEFNIFELKNIFSTASHEAIAIRTLSFAPAIVTIIDDKKVTNRQSSVQGIFGKKLIPIEKETAKKTVSTGRITHLKNEDCTVSGYPLLEEGVKRVILRTVPTHDFY